MEQINIHEAKTKLSSLVAKAAKGETFIIAKAGKPMVKVVPYTEPAKTSRTGFLKDQITIPEDFDRMCAAEIAEIFGVNK
jgi:prevent-host-death family protein